MSCFFFFKQKTAYEMLRSLVGSEMCIRDSTSRVRSTVRKVEEAITAGNKEAAVTAMKAAEPEPVSYTHLTLPTIYSV